MKNVLKPGVEASQFSSYELSDNLQNYPEDDTLMDCINEVVGENTGPCLRNESSVNYCNNYALNIAQRQCRTRPAVMLLGDSWGGNKNIQFQRRLREIATKFILIPKLTTAHLQPLDVGFNRQYKIFVTRLMNAAYHERKVAEITSREGHINVHSLIWNQFGSPAYRDMIRRAWHNTDPEFNVTELSRQPVAVVRDIQFSFPPGSQCQHAGHSRPAFIRCSHCGKLLCLQHFLERVCFHEGEDTDHDLPFNVSLGEDLSSDLSELEDDEYDIYLGD